MNIDIDMNNSELLMSSSLLSALKALGVPQNDIEFLADSGVNDWDTLEDFVTPWNFGALEPGLPSNVTFVLMSLVSYIRAKKSMCDAVSDPLVMFQPVEFRGWLLREFAHNDEGYMGSLPNVCNNGKVLVPCGTGGGMYISLIADEPLVFLRDAEDVD